MEYIYPPRPKLTIPPKQLPDEERRGIWFWQPKYDGDRCVVAIHGKHIGFSNRHGKFHSSGKFRFLEPQVATLDLPAGGTYLDGELLENKIIVFFDVLQYDGKYLIGMNQLERVALLRKICREPTKLCGRKVAFEITPNLWMSLQGNDHFLENFEQLTSNTLVEGLLLRQKDSSLDHWGRSEYDVDWQLRCRKNTKNYRY